MLRPFLALSIKAPLRARLTTTIPYRAPISPIRSLNTQTTRIAPTFFQPHPLALRPSSRSLSLRFPSRAFSARHYYISLFVRLGLSTVLGLGLLIGVILFHDAFTYSERHVDRVPINPLSLHPRLGGKKGLPILEVNLDDEDEGKKGMQGKPRLVIIGGGWGVSPPNHACLPVGLIVE